MDPTIDDGATTIRRAAMAARYEPDAPVPRICATSGFFSAVFIDDLEENVEGAVRAGISGIVFRGRNQLVQQLQNLGVNVPEIEE